MHPEHPMRDGVPPVWASSYGVDAFGPFAAFAVEGITQRMRWVAPGTFQMGDGTSRSTVRLTLGYWMADTPVTQALWSAVTGENPSRFVHPSRPVETVTWEGAQSFIERLNQAVPDLDVRLPTEAEWECACRAGTTTDTWAGDLDVQGDHNAPILDAIAWYGGNCGVNFDLEQDQSMPGTVWKEKQYDFDVGGTRIVGLKAPNPLGLYDMLGNVFEWCQDWHAEIAAEATDPAGPERGSYRVIRGGSWYSDARSVRAAYRHAYRPGYRHDRLGFRLSRGPAPSARSAEPSAERGRRSRKQTK